jgi:hyperosmotically inducible periplasmic protein
MRKTITLALAAFMVLGALAGCATNRPADEQLDDAEITARVKAKLIADPEVAALNIDVDTVDGVVTLTGEVDSDTARLEAEQLARTTDGVVRVISRIRVN